MTQAHDLTLGSPAKHLMRMTLPMSWGLFSIIAINLVDTFFIAQLGLKQLAAIGFIIPLLAILRSLAFGIGGGAISVIARSLGAKQYEKVHQYCAHALLLSVIVAVLFSVMGWWFAPTFFTWMGAEADVLVHILSYTDIWFLGTVVTVLPMVGNACIRASGTTFIPSMIMTIVAVVNAILDPIFIFGALGIPAMGMPGAALATVLAYCFAAIASIYMLRTQLHWLSWQAFRCDVIKIWKEILYVGIPSVFTNLLTPLSATITTALVARYGSAAVAGYGVAIRMETLSLVFVVAMSAVIGPFVGQNWGAKLFERVRTGLFFSYQFAFVWAVILAVMFYCYAQQLIALFSAEVGAMHAAVSYLTIVPITFGFLGLCMITSNTANAIRKPLFAVLLTSCRLLIVFVPLALLLGMWFQLTGIFIATAITNCVVAGLSLIWYRKYIPKFLQSA